MPNAECGLQIADLRIAPTKCGMWNPDLNRPEEQDMVLSDNEGSGRK
jgi:hypothetical protein